MKKSHQIITIFCILLIILLVAIVVYFSQGARIRSLHYIKLNSKSKIEFLTDAKNVVKGVYPINIEAMMVVVDENFIGLDIENAIDKYLDICMKMGYFDLVGGDNGIQISVSSSFTQSLENKIYKVCNEFFIKNEILCVIAESDSDLKLYHDKQANKVFNIEKLVLINSIIEKTDQYNFDAVNKMNESEIVDKLEDLVKNNTVINNNNKNTLLDNKYYNIDNYKQIYNNHINNITNKSQSEFVQKYAKFKKSQTNSWELDFDKKLNESNLNDM